MDRTRCLIHVLAVLDREASVLEQGRPLGKCKTAPVTRIAKLLEIVIHGRPIARVGRDVVHEREYAVRHQHSERLLRKRAGVLEVMRSEPAGYKIEAHIGKGQILGSSARGPEIDQTSCFGKFLGFDQHRIGHIACGDASDTRRKGKRGVSRAGSDIEHAPGRLGIDELDQPCEARASRVHRRSRIFGGSLTEFPLNEGGHAAPLGSRLSGIRGCRRSGRQAPPQPPSPATRGACGRAAPGDPRNCG